MRRDPKRSINKVDEAPLSPAAPIWSEAPGGYGAAPVLCVLSGLRDIPIKSRGQAGQRQVTANMDVIFLGCRTHLDAAKITIRTRLGEKGQNCEYKS
ncbi:MAG: hypothetical protein ACXV4Z_07460 [Halobacteriota archaeon]